MTFTFSTGLVSGGSPAVNTAESGTIPSNVWCNVQPVQTATDTNTSHYTARYFYTDSSAGNTTDGVTITATGNFSAVVGHTNFTGVVTFSGGTFSKDGTNITTIDGGSIETGTITANELAISANTDVTNVARMFFNTQIESGVQQNAIEIFDASNVLRVKIGKLA